MSSLLGGLARRALHALLPADCASCGAPLRDDPVPLFCRTCWSSIRPLTRRACPRCGRPYFSSVPQRAWREYPCGGCRIRRPAYTRARSLYAYEGPLRDAICLFKYRGKVSLRPALVQLMIDAWHGGDPADLVMPVPLHPSRLREREFNQSLLLADGLSRALRVPLSLDDLLRVRATRPQAELTQAQRRKGLRGCFAVRRPSLVAGKRILLIDDVFTTGTTVNECAKTLRKAGSGHVDVVTLARTL